MANWDERFLELADFVSGWSKDPSTKVGCVLVSDRKVVLGIGYNGFPRGVEDTLERLEDRPTKYKLVQHAERNAIQQSDGSLVGSAAYVTAKPCAQCCGALIQAGVTKIIAWPSSEGLSERLKDDYLLTDEMLVEAGVDYTEKTPKIDRAAE